jgi:hypothetical protein
MIRKKGPTLGDEPSNLIYHVRYCVLTVLLVRTLDFIGFLHILTACVSGRT